MDSHSAPTGQDPPGDPGNGSQGEGGKGGFGEAYGLPGPPKEGVLGPQAHKAQEDPALVVTRQGSKEVQGPKQALPQKTPAIVVTMQGVQEVLGTHEPPTPKALPPFQKPPMSW